MGLANKIGRGKTDTNKQLLELQTALVRANGGQIDAFGAAIVREATRRLKQGQSINVKALVRQYNS